MKIHFRILSLIMAFAVTFSSVGVTVSKHLCGGEIRDIALFQNAEPCDHSSEPLVVNCPIHDDMVIHPDAEQDDCCTDTKEVVKDDHPKNITSTDISVSPQFFIVYVYHLFISEINKFYLSIDSPLGDPAVPPLINQVTYILVNSFRL